MQRSRKNLGKEYQVYLANPEEAVGKNGSVITDCQCELNNYSYSQFIKDSLKRNGKQKEKVLLVADDAYSGKGNHGLAAERSSHLVNTDLSGKPVNDILTDFVLNES